MEILELINYKKNLESELNMLIYGSIEVRTKDGNDYIYVHYRMDGISLTKYVGPYSEELHNLILKNTIKARALKKEIKKISKELSALGYVEQEISRKVALNIDMARRELARAIYTQAVLEGIATTYADTETIIEGGRVNNMTSNDVLKVINLKRAWEFILNKDVITSPTNFTILAEINKLVENGFYYNAGRIRTTPVSIGGTNWKPPLPIESVVKEELQEIINADDSETETAINLMLYVMKKQIFLDGNKRTATIFANHYLISRGAGLIIIPSEHVAEFKNCLIEYYENGNDKIKQLIKTFLVSPVR